MQLGRGSVQLHVAHHAFGLALGPRALRTARLGREAVVVGQLQEPGIEDHAPVAVMLEHRRLLVIDQHRARYATEVVERLHQGLVGVLGVLTRCRPGMEAARVAQGVDGEIDRAVLAGHHGLDFAPVVLQLEAGLGLETHGLLAGPQGPLGLDVHPHQGAATGIALFADQLEDHLGVPDIIGQQLINDRLVGIQLTGTRLRGTPCRCRLTSQVAPHGAFGAADLMGDVHEVSASLAKLLYHEKVLSAQHGAVLTGLVTSKERSCGSGGQSVLMIYGLIAPASTKAARVFVANELEPLQEALKEVNEIVGEEIIQFRSYSLDGGEGSPLDPSR